MLMRTDLSLNSLREQMLSEPLKLPVIKKMFKEFRCVRDGDIERFVQNNAVAFEKSGLARTYFYTIGNGLESRDEAGIAAFKCRLQSRCG
jgi:hypothetical protein